MPPLPTASCSWQLSAFRLPGSAEAAAAFRNATRRADETAHVQRRVWDLIPFGFELDMLLLHMRTLEQVVDGFLVTEATTTHIGDEPKPMLAADAVAAGRVPSSLVHKLHLRKVVFADERPRFCPTMHTRCYEALQRFLLLEMLFEVAAPNDVALVNDVDEFARPSVVSMLRHCYPFDATSGMPYYVVLRLSLFKFGVHCDHGNTFLLGTRAFSVGRLMTTYGHQARVTPRQREAMSADFTETRSRFFSAPMLPDAGWHLTSFGEPAELSRKLRTFLHANIFRTPDKVAKGSLDVHRLERCMRYCLDLDRPMVGGLMPPCNSRTDPKSKPLPGTLRTSLATADLPRALVQHRAEWPSSWFRFVAS